MERRLAAILAADVVGFSKLMGVDERGTLERLKALQENVIDPLIGKHRGRVVKLMGDGYLVEFPSVVDAVECAMAWQSAVGEDEHGKPESEQLRFRIGIILGDIIVDGDDIYGDGVNIAARLEGLAEPGGLCVSGDACRQLRGKLDLNWESIGQQDLKNISEPVEAFLLRLLTASKRASEAPSLQLPEKPSIAVLPFANMSGDPEQEYLADGITEDLITGLSRIRWFFIIARNSTFTYKGQAVDVKQVSRELGVRYVLEGSVRKAGNRVRITAQLIDATTGRHVWAERYDREIEDIFALQDEMTQTIVAAVEPELSAVERERARGKSPDSLDAWETYQRGLWHMWSYLEHDNGAALRLLARAHELDPNFAPAYAYESYAHYQSLIMGWTEDAKETLHKAMELARTALAIDDRDAVAYFAIGRVHMMRGEHDDSIDALNTSINLNPSFAQAYHGLGMTLTLAGRLDEAKDALGQSERLSPRDPILWASTVVHSLACVLSNDYEEALRWAERTIRNPRSKGYWPHALMAACLAHLNRIEEAQAQIRAAVEQTPDLSLDYLQETLPTKAPNGLAPYLDGLRLAGLPEQGPTTS